MISKLKNEIDTFEQKICNVTALVTNIKQVLARIATAGSTCNNARDNAPAMRSPTMQLLTTPPIEMR